MPIVQLSFLEGKVCRDCGLWMPLSEFSPHTPRCKPCTRIYDRNRWKTRRERDLARRRERYAKNQEHAEGIRAASRQYRANNPDKVRELNIKYRQAHQEELRQYAREYQQTNRAQLLQANKRNYQANRERYLVQARQWRQANQEKRKVYEHQRRAAKKGGGGHVPYRQWVALCDWVGNCCLRCGSTEKLTMDHVVPLVYQGTHTIDNIQPLCLSCNASKSDNIADYRDPSQLAEFLKTL